MITIDISGEPADELGLLAARISLDLQRQGVPVQVRANSEWRLNERIEGDAAAYNQLLLPTPINIIVQTL